MKMLDGSRVVAVCCCPMPRRPAERGRPGRLGVEQPNDTRTASSTVQQAVASSMVGTLYDTRTEPRSENMHNIYVWNLLTGTWYIIPTSRYDACICQPAGVNVSTYVIPFSQSK